MAKRDLLPPLTPASLFPNDLYINDEWQSIAEHVPGGWAGAHIISTVQGGLKYHLVLNFVDTTDMTASLDSLDAHWHFWGVYWQYFGKPPLLVRDSVLLNVVRWDWVQLNEWYRYITRVAGLPPELVGAGATDISESANVLRFGAVSAAARVKLLQRLLQLGVPCWLAGVYVVGAHGNLKSPQPAPGIVSAGDDEGGVKEVR